MTEGAYSPSLLQSGAGESLALENPVDLNACHFHVVKTLPPFQVSDAPRGKPLQPPTLLESPWLTVEHQEFTDRDHPRRGVADWQRPPSPCCIAEGELHRPAPSVARGLYQRQSPTNIDINAYSSASHLLDTTYQSRVSDQLACKPEEGFLEVVVGFGRYVIVLEILLSVEGDGLRFNFALLDVYLVAAEHDGDLLADTNEIA